MTRQQRRALIRSLPACRATHAAGASCRSRRFRARLPGERRPLPAHAIVALAGALAR